MLVGVSEGVPLCSLFAATYPEKTEALVAMAVMREGEIAAVASPGELVVSRTVVDLVPGSGLQFAERGVLRLRG